MRGILTLAKPSTEVKSLSCNPMRVSVAKSMSWICFTMCFSPFDAECIEVYIAIIIELAMKGCVDTLRPYFVVTFEIENGLTDDGEGALTDGMVVLESYELVHV